MKLKYGLQGFGVGVLFATILLSISFMTRTDNSSMTDEEVIERAKILGMVMETEQHEIVVVTENDSEKIQETSAAKEIETETEIETEISTEPETETTVRQETSALATEPVTDASVPEPTVGIEMSEMGILEEDQVMIQIPSGVNSDEVARILEEEGVVDDAVQLDNYMVRLGVSRYVRTGTYILRKNMTYDEVVDMICR